jgi:hypothetical protein
METLKSPLNKAQLDILRMLGRIKTDEELAELKNLIGRYFADKATREADRIWDERGYTQETMDQWLNDPNQ